MMEAQNSDDELLAMLQPLSMPDEFAFESSGIMNVDTTDEDEPGPAPVAPMAPMVPMAPIEGDIPVAPVASMVIDSAEPPAQSQPETLNGIHGDSPSASTAVANDVSGSQSQNQPESSSANDIHTNGVNEEDPDSDAIAYEPLRTPARSRRSGVSKPRSTSKPTRSRPRPTFSNSRSTLKIKSSRQLATLLTSPAKVDGETQAEVESDSQPLTTESAPAPAEPKPEPTPDPTPKPPTIEFEIVIRPVPSQAAQEYKPIPPGDEIYRVLEKIPTGVPGETWLSVEFEDGRIDQVSWIGQDTLTFYIFSNRCQNHLGTNTFKLFFTWTMSPLTNFAQTPSPS